MSTRCVYVPCITVTEYRRVSFYDRYYILEYLVVNRILVKRVLFKWFRLRYVHGPNKLVK